MNKKEKPLKVSIKTFGCQMVHSRATDYVRNDKIFI